VRETIRVQAYDVLSEETSRRKYDAVIKPDLYKVLHISRTATLREIIISFRKLARTHHPDKGGKQRRFDLIKEAYRYRKMKVYLNLLIMYVIDSNHSLQNSFGS
jgi:curved DNA-binding protein